MATLEKNVLRLDVAMNDVQCMRSRECVGDLARNANGIGHGELLLTLEPCAQRLAGDKRHDVIQQATCVSAVEQRENMRMLDLCSGADLAQEAFRAERRAKVRVQHLDGDVSIVLDVVREEDGGHATCADLAL